MSADALADAVARQAAQAGKASRATYLAEVVGTNPLEVELIGSRQVLDEDDDLIIAAHVQSYIDQLDEDDVVLVDHRDAEWIVTGVLTDKTVTVGIPSTRGTIGASNPAESASGRDLSHMVRRGETALMMGGGTITVASDFGISWSNRFIIIDGGKGPDFSTSGYFDIMMPADGAVLTGVDSTPSITVASGKIILPTWTALYYILPLGSNNVSQTGNFRVVRYDVINSGRDIPWNWVLVAIRCQDAFPNQFVKWGTGHLLRNGESVTADRRVPNLSITDAQVAAANKDGAAGTASMRTLGTGATQAAAGNHGHALSALLGTGFTADQIPAWSGSAWAPAGNVKIGGNLRIGDATIRRYSTQYSFTRAAGDIVKMGEFTHSGASQNVCITGTVRITGGPTGGLVRFVIWVRSNALPDVVISFHQEPLVAQAYKPRIRVWKDGVVNPRWVVGYDWPTGSPLNHGWDIEVMERGDYNSWQNVNNAQLVDTTGLTEVTLPGGGGIHEYPSGWALGSNTMPFWNGTVWSAATPAQIAGEMGMSAFIQTLIDDADAAAARATLGLGTSGKGFVNHGSDPNVARPAGYASIEWQGTVQPNNAINVDTWVQP